MFDYLASMSQLESCCRTFSSTYWLRGHIQRLLLLILAAFVASVLWAAAACRRSFLWEILLYFQALCLSVQRHQVLCLLVATSMNFFLLLNHVTKPLIFLSSGVTFHFYRSLSQFLIHEVSQMLSTRCTFVCSHLLSSLAPAIFLRPASFCWPINH